MNTPKDTSASLSQKDLCPEELLSEQEAAFQRDVDRMLVRKHEFVQVACPACQGKTSRKVFEKYGLSYEECAQCLTLFVSPRPTPEILHAFYAQSENYEFWAKKIFPASEQARIEKLNKPWLAEIEHIAGSYNKPHQVLVEVGPGFGSFAKLARESKLFQRVVCIEPNPDMAKSCREKGLEVVETSIEQVPDGLVQGDVLVAFEVIEHLFEPEVFLKQCKKLLQPGGLLIVSCPNGRGFDVEILRAHARAVDAEHLNLFNPRALGLLLERCGYTVLQAKTPGRLDAEIVREAMLEGKAPGLKESAFFRRVLIDEWEKCGAAFQQFLVSAEYSSHMWVLACRED